MTWHLFVSLRYLAAKRKERFISVINLISILGVTVGVAALIIVIAVMSGFDNDLKDKIIGTYSHMEITSDFGMAPSSELASKVLDTDHVVAGAFFLNGQALARRSDNVCGVVVKGIEPANEIKVNKLGQYIRKGSLDFGKDGIVIGSELAKRLGAGIGEAVSIISPANPKGKDFTVRGIFTSGMYEYDANLVYLDLAETQELFGAKGMASGITVRVDDAMNVMKVKRILQAELGPPFLVRTWMDLNKNLLEALKLEKTVMFLILILIVTVACLNIASALIMTVLEKTRDIGILKAIGAANSDIMAIFAMQGSAVGVIGTAAGASLGILACWLLKTYKFIALPSDIYYIDRLPVNLNVQDISLIIISSLIISFASTIYPSYKASSLDPIEALRYE